ncbi:MAG: hypothetical protein ACNS64_05670 [Candidatus Halalkalibacterium sp. M3_1C_030]
MQLALEQLPVEVVKLEQQGDEQLLHILFVSLKPPQVVHLTSFVLGVFNHDTAGPEVIFGRFVIGYEHQLRAHRTPGVLAAVVRGAHPTLPEFVPHVKHLWRDLTFTGDELVHDNRNLAVVGQLVFGRLQSGIGIHVCKRLAEEIQHDLGQLPFTGGRIPVQIQKYNMLEYVIDFIEEQEGTHKGKDQVPFGFLFGLLPGHQLPELLPDAVNKIPQLIAGENVIFFGGIKAVNGPGEVQQGSRLDASRFNVEGRIGRDHGKHAGSRLRSNDILRLLQVIFRDGNERITGQVKAEPVMLDEPVIVKLIYRSGLPPVTQVTHKEQDLIVRLKPGRLVGVFKDLYLEGLLRQQIDRFQDKVLASFLPAAIAVQPHHLAFIEGLVPFQAFVIVPNDLGMNHDVKAADFPAGPIGFIPVPAVIHVG